MKRTSRTTRRRPAPLRRAQRNLGPRHLRAMSKGELVALVLDLQSGRAEPQAAAEPATEPRTHSLVIESSVRSGQTIEFPHGDVTVIGSVGSGAEIVAGGSIHVYGTLRGRAVAGMSGDRKARIFCHSLQAELLSIDGHYRVAENFDPGLRGRPVQARLDGMKMTLVALEPGERIAGERDLFGGLRPRAAGRLMSFIGRGPERSAAALPR